MDIFDIHQGILDEYKEFVNGFIHIKNQAIRNKVEKELQDGKLWPDPLIQFNPAYKREKTAEELCDEGTLHPEVGKMFQGFNLYTHQVRALNLGAKDQDFIVTTGTGSGKSLTYLGTIFNYIMNNPSDSGIKAIIVYPMNALINSQYEAVQKLKNGYAGSGGIFPRVARYTGQEGQDERERIKNNGWS